MREELKWFAERMEEVLKENDHKGGWEDIHPSDLLEALRFEVYDLETALWYDDGDVIKECCDIANYAMMIADIARKQHGTENSTR